MIAHPFLFPQVPFAPRSGLPQAKSRPGHVGAAPPRRMQLAGLPSKPSPTFASPDPSVPVGAATPRRMQPAGLPSKPSPTFASPDPPVPVGAAPPRRMQPAGLPSKPSPTFAAPTHRFPWEPRPRGECSPQGCQQPQPTTKPHPSADSRQSVPPARPSAGSRRCIALLTSDSPHAVALGHEIRPARSNARYASPRSI